MMGHAHADPHTTLALRHYSKLKLPPGDLWIFGYGSLMWHPEIPYVQWAPALVFYFAYPAALVALALFPSGQPFSHQVARAALVGLVAYGVYDLTNLSTLRHWPLKLALVDTAWGTFASVAAGAAAAWVAQRFN